MKRLAALLLLALPTVARAEGAHLDAAAPSPPFTDGAQGGLRLVFEAGRARLGVEAGDPVGHRLLASMPGEGDFVEAREALQAMLDGIRRLAGAEGVSPPPLVPTDPAGATGCPAVRVVGPRVVSVPVLVSLPLSGALRGLLEPALDIGWTTSRLSLAQAGSAHGDDASGPGFGFQLSAGLEMSLTDILGLSVKAGWRVLRAPAADREAIAGAVVAPLPGAGGEADLGGAYGTLGAVLRI
jgi:hypothetical protein